MDEILIDGETDGNEVPLGKIIKHLKSQKIKAKKVKKNKVSSANAEKAENDVDILNMVREINLDNLGESSKFESSNGHEKFPSKKSRIDTKHQKGNKRKASEGVSVPVPKRRRSSSTHSAFRSPRSTSKSPLSASLDDSLSVRISSFQSIDISSETYPEFLTIKINVYAEKIG